MGKYIKQTNCDNCHSSDAKTIYEDGSSYCFSCGQSLNPSLRRMIFKQKASDKVAKNIDSSNWSLTIPERCLQWLDNYDLSENELGVFRWDYKRESLVMPIWHHGRVVCASYRYFGEDKDHPKSKTEGNKPYVTILDKTDKTDLVVIVEDYISAVKVSRVARCIPVLGSNVPSLILERICKEYAQVVFWLDSDKIDVSVKLAQTARLYGCNGYSLYTTKDPKCYTEEQIFKLLKTRIKLD